MTNLLKKALPYLAAALIAAGGFFLGTVPNLDAAIKIVFDKEAAKAECAKLLEGE